MLLVLLLSFSIAVLNSSFASNEGIISETGLRGLFYLKQVYETVSRNYVDEVDPEGLSKSAIEALFRN